MNCNAPNLAQKGFITAMKTNAEATATENTANVAEQGAQVAAPNATSKKGASRQKGAPRGQQRAKAAKPATKPKANKKDKAGAKPTAAREGTVKAMVIALMQAKGGTTIDEIRRVTKWQPHTIRGFVSILGKHGMKIESRRREDGVRVYEVK